MKLSEELTRVLCTYDDDDLNWYRHEYGQALDFVHMSTKLVPTDIVEGREQRVHKMPPSPNRWKERSRTYQGIANAMAAQWG